MVAKIGNLYDLTLPKFLKTFFCRLGTSSILNDDPYTSDVLRLALIDGFSCACTS